MQTPWSEEVQAELTVLKEPPSGAEFLERISRDMINPGTEGAWGGGAWQQSSGGITAEEQGDSWENCQGDGGLGGWQEEVARGITQMGGPESPGEPRSNLRPVVLLAGSPGQTLTTPRGRWME